jgi:hypothetical protein
VDKSQLYAHHADNDDSRQFGVGSEAAPAHGARESVRLRGARLRVAQVQRGEGAVAVPAQQQLPARTHGQTHHVALAAREPPCVVSVTPGQCAVRVTTRARAARGESDTTVSCSPAR